MPAFGEGYPPGLVVWARLESYPWRPSVVVDRAEAEGSLDADETLGPATASNRTVRFFNDDDRVSAIELSDLRVFPPASARSIELA